MDNTYTSYNILLNISERISKTKGHSKAKYMLLRSAQLQQEAMFDYFLTECNFKGEDMNTFFKLKQQLTFELDAFYNLHRDNKINYSTEITTVTHFILGVMYFVKSDGLYNNKNKMCKFLNENLFKNIKELYARNKVI